MSRSPEASNDKKTKREKRKKTFLQNKEGRFYTLSQCGRCFKCVLNMDTYNVTPENCVRLFVFHITNYKAYTQTTVLKIYIVPLGRYRGNNPSSLLSAKCVVLNLIVFQLELKQGIHLHIKDRWRRFINQKRLTFQKNIFLWRCSLNSFSVDRSEYKTAEIWMVRNSL